MLFNYKLFLNDFTEKFYEIFKKFTEKVLKNDVRFINDIPSIPEGKLNVILN